MTIDASYDYYVRTELIIEYIHYNGLKCSICTNINIENCRINNIPRSTSLESTFQRKGYNDEITRKITKKTCNKMIFENGAWIKESYKKRYEKRLITTFREIKGFIKIYKKNTASIY